MKNKNKLKYLTLGILLTGALGFSTLAVKQVQVKAENENVVNINRENKKLVSYDDTTFSVTLNAEELNNYTWNNFYDTLSTYGEDAFLPHIIYNSVTYNGYSANINGNTVCVVWDRDTNNDLSIGFNAYISNVQENIVNLSSKKFVIYNYDIQQFIDFDYSLTINFQNLQDFENYYDAFKDAIELDIQANESRYGESIITAISSGLGLIPNLAQEFLTGFTTLFWDSAQEKLTDFGTFALVFLGVAITMAVVKLCLAILRSNTGA